MKMLHPPALVALALTMPLLANADEHLPLPNKAGSDYDSALAVAVRNATSSFQHASVRQLTAAGYVQATPCVSGPDEGAMGVHWINFMNLGQFNSLGQLDLTKPPVLIFEPQSDGSQQLVGVEYVLPLPIWQGANPGAPADPYNPPPGGASLTPSVDGQLMNFQPVPNRFGQGDSFYLHLWAWRPNPKGLFSDWNPNVTCANQPHS